VADIMPQQKTFVTNFTLNPPFAHHHKLRYNARIFSV